MNKKRITSIAILKNVKPNRQSEIMDSLRDPGYDAGVQFSINGRSQSSADDGSNIGVAEDGSSSIVSRQGGDHLSQGGEAAVQVRQYLPILDTLPSTLYFYLDGEEVNKARIMELTEEQIETVTRVMRQSSVYVVTKQTDLSE